MEQIQQHAEILAVTLVAMAVFGATIGLAWPYLIPTDVSRRLREQLQGPGERKRKAADAVQSQPEKAKLQTRPSEALNKLVSTFHSSERASDGKIAAQLQQAGFRGRAAAVKYMALRIWFGR